MTSGGVVMSVKLAFLALLEARGWKGGELGDFLRSGRELAVAPSIQPVDVIAVK
jgi:hypothetical protein